MYRTNETNPIFRCICFSNSDEFQLNEEFSQFLKSGEGPNAIKPISISRTTEVVPESCGSTFFTRIKHHIILVYEASTLHTSFTNLN